MKRPIMRSMLCGFAFFLALRATGGAQEFFNLPPAPPPEEYGNVTISRTGEEAVFSHWQHRQKFTCRVCHFELEFNMQVNTTEITEEASKSGRYCGAAGCHDGKAAFGHEKPYCEKCHDSPQPGKKKFSKLSKLPKSKYGNGIDWVQAIDKGLIKPVNYLAVKPPSDIAVIKPLLLEAEWSGIPPAVFSHKMHVAWLDCNNCHPDIFNIKLKTTKHFSMKRILDREFCGVCHMTVAFPMDDCKRCHTEHPNLVE